MTDYWDAVSDLPSALDKICVATDKDTTTQTDITRILKDIPYRSEWRVLEVGCGVGRLLLPLRNIFEIVDGVDFSENMIKLSKDYLKDQHNGFAIKNDGKTLPFYSHYYDFVFAFTVFQHIRSVKTFQSYLFEMYRVLRQGGYMRFQLHEVNPLFGRWEEDFSTPWGNAYTPDELRDMVGVYFKDIEIVEEKPWVWLTAKK